VVVTWRILSGEIAGKIFPDFLTSDEVFGNLLNNMTYSCSPENSESARLYPWRRCPADLLFLGLDIGYGFVLPDTPELPIFSTFAKNPPPTPKRGGFAFL